MIFYLKYRLMDFLIIFFIYFSMWSFSVAQQAMFALILVLSAFFVRSKKGIDLVGAFNFGKAIQFISFLVLIYFLSDHLRRYFGVEKLEIPRDQIVTAVIAVVFAGPIVEELIFRHLAFRAFPFDRSRVWCAIAIISSSFLFALSHSGHPASLVGTFLIGVVFGIARISSGGLMMPIILHASYNLSVIIDTSAI